MGDHSKIEWTDATWTVSAGCAHVSPGCDRCYAASLVAGRLKTSKAYGGLATNTPEGPRFSGEIRLLPERLDQPLRWKKPRMIFVNSMSDLFHADVPFGYILRVFDVMARCPQHTFQILTKRPGRMRLFMERLHDLTGETDEFRNARGPDATRAAHPSGRGQLFAQMLDSMGDPPPGAAYPLFDWVEGMRWWPRSAWDHVWLGTSVENQHYADTRIPELLKTPAAVRFISAEPLLGPVDVHSHLDAGMCDECSDAGCADGTACACGCHRTIDWVIVGGESGPGARPMDLAWARSLVEQCRAAGAAVFVKQLGAQPGEYRDINSRDGSPGFFALRVRDSKGGDIAEFPEDLRVREMPEART